MPPRKTKLDVVSIAANDLVGDASATYGIDEAPAAFVHPSDDEARFSESVALMRSFSLIANAEIDGTDLIYKNYYHVGVAVGTDKGLVVVLKNAQTNTLITA